MLSKLVTKFVQLRIRKTTKYKIKYYILSKLNSRQLLEDFESLSRTSLIAKVKSSVESESNTVVVIQTETRLATDKCVGRAYYLWFKTENSLLHE